MNLTKYWPEAVTAAKHSKDPRTQVGAAIVDHRGVVRATGWNGFPRGVNDDPARYADREIKLKLVVHAEANAIANAAAVGVPLEGCGLIVTKFPCHECAKLIIQSGIKKVVAPSPDSDGLWAGSAVIGCHMFEEAGVEIEYLEKK